MRTRLKQKLDTFEKVMQHFAKAYSDRAVPNWVWGSNGPTGGTDSHFVSFLQTLQAKFLKDLGLDMSMPKGSTAKVK